MRGVGKFAGQILSRPVELFVQPGAPLGAVGHVVDGAVMGNVGGRAVAVVVEAELGFGEGSFGHDI